MSNIIFKADGGKYLGYSLFRINANGELERWFKSSHVWGSFRCDDYVKKTDEYMKARQTFESKHRWK